MAPNLKRTQLLLQTVDLDLVQPIKAAFPPLTSEDAEQSQNSSYWEWSAEDDADINNIVHEERFSADHIVANTLRSHQPADKASVLSTANADQYWDWSLDAEKESDDYLYWNWQTTCDEEQQERVALPASAQEVDSYWAW
eukprot:CAMPEP_0113611386 /NCGR_PEP_ID=MMETSP0017_2-20120614/5529_1 /TAXON_ID=2856 /ORGANISM="Cylindrotheca closterium" /LENGTH=139 /DNA_ID=CAMNT_0000520331 /DNA_START=1603 /DNA_END=2022 /DNA_ORIENTATION=- /assembly_acc=CAM_ASM_000147